MSAVKKRLSFCLKGDRVTGVSEEGFSVALAKGFPNTARYNKWALNFESSKSQVPVEESFPHDVLLTDNPKLLCSCLRTCRGVGSTSGVQRPIHTTPSLIKMGVANWLLNHWFIILAFLWPAVSLLK